MEIFDEHGIGGLDPIAPGNITMIPNASAQECPGVDDLCCDEILRDRERDVGIIGDPVPGSPEQDVAPDSPADAAEKLPVRCEE